jgi:uncharacterized protein YcnI
MTRRAVITALAILLLAPATALAHAEISPAVSLKDRLQLYSLAVPTEKENVSTTKIVLTLPKGFSIDSFVPSPGWHRLVQQAGTGEDAVVQNVTWTGGHVPTEEDSLFQFLAQAASSGTYRFTVQQTYSDGSIVNWAGPESSDAPAPTLEVRSAFGGGGGSTPLTIAALIVGVVGLLLGGFALLGASGRPLA